MVSAVISSVGIVGEAHAEASQAFDRMAQAAASLADAHALALCRSRVAGLLRQPTSEPVEESEAERIAALREWPTSPLFSDMERACLAFTEQFMVDVAGVTKEQADAVLLHMSPERFFGFVNALWVYDQGLRLRMTLERFSTGRETDE